MEALILCAGKSTRFRNNKNKLTKLLSNYRNKSLLKFHIDKCKNYGFKKIFFNVHFQIKNIIEEIKREIKVNFYISKEKKLLGTCGAFYKIRNKVKNDFFIIYPDNISNCNYTKMMNFHKKKKSDFTIATYSDDNLKNSGTMEFLINKKIINFIEKRKNQKKMKKWCNAGIYIVSKKIIKFVSKKDTDFAKDLIPRLINQNYNLYAFQIDKLLTFDTIQQYKKNYKKNIN